MSYSYDPNLDPNKKDDQDTQLAGGSQILGGDGQAAYGSAQTPGKPTSSGQYQNLNSYLDANKDSGFGGQFTGKLNESVAGANQAQDTSGQSFKQKSDQGSTYDNPSYTSSIQQDPTTFAKDANNVSGFKNQLNAQYKGPYSYADDASDYQSAYGATQKAQSETQAAQSEPGRFALLNNYFGKPTYNQGQKSLDNLLIQGDQTTQQGIEQARQNANQSAANFQGQEKDLGNYAAANLGRTEAAKKSAQSALGLNSDGTFSDTSDYKTQQNKLSKEATDFNAQTSKDAQKLAAFGTFNQPDLGVWQGGSPNSTGYNDQNFYGLSPDSYMNYTDANSQNVNDPATKARINALEQLSGGPVSAFDTSTTPGYQFDRAGFIGGVKDARNTYAADLSRLQSQPGGSASDIQALNKKYGQPTDTGSSGNPGKTGAGSPWTGFQGNHSNVYQPTPEEQEAAARQSMYEEDRRRNWSFQ